MFQGSAHVKRGEHFALVNAAGGTLNGTTWCDRTNYYETVPVPPSRHRAVAGGRPDGRAARRARPANLDNQREVVKNEKRQSRDNQPYGSLARAPARAVLPGEPPVPPHDDRLHGRPRRRLARGRPRRSTRPGTRPTTPCSRSSATSTPPRRWTWPRTYFGGIPAKGGFPTPPPTRHPDPRIGARGTPYRHRPGAGAADVRRLPHRALRHPGVRRGAGRGDGARWRPRQPALQGAGARPAAAPAVRVGGRQLAVHRGQRR